MKAIIRLDIPDYQIGQEVFCYFKDSMTIKGMCEEDNTEEIERFATQQLLSETSEDSQCDSCDYDYDPRSGECYDCVKGNDERYVTAEEYSTWDKFTLNEDEQEPCEDCISREAVLEAFGLSEKSRKYGGDHSGYDTLMKYEIQDILEDLPSVTPTQKWIPVSERLPEEETDVLICNRNGDIALSRGSYSTEIENDFMWYTSGWRFGKVIAWQPLPQPYKIGSEAKK